METMSDVSNNTSPTSKIFERKRRRMRIILAIVVSLLVLSILNMISTTSIYSSTTVNSVVKNHIGYIVVGVVLSCIVSMIDYRNYHKNSWSKFFLIISLVILSFVAIGARLWPNIIPTINGSSGWIRVFGRSFQPSEFIKLPFVLVLSHLLANCDEKKADGYGIILTVLPIIVGFSILINFQNDTGTIIHYAIILLFMLFCSKIDIKRTILLVTPFIGIVIGYLIRIYVAGYDATAGYKTRRIWGFLVGILNNEYDDNIGYQVGQSVMAFGNGGIIGQGYANGTQKYSYLPEIRTDFIMATVGEEFGFAGMLIFIIVLYLLFSVIKSTAIDCEDVFGKYLAMGIGGLLITQVWINLSVALGLIPVFGIPMPLISAGGTSIITILFGLAIILNMNFNSHNKLEK